MYGENIRKFRRMMGLSQLELGEKLGVSAVSVSKWERGQTQPDIQTLLAMADLFNTTVDKLCDRPERKMEEQPEKLRVMTRAFRQMTDDEQEKYLAVGRALFAHAFETPQPVEAEADA